MDSLTQIVLGAAVGEVVLGRKVGNRAILWGAVAGTIPDLDVYCGYIFDDLRKNELHRAFSHSLLFSLVCAPIFAWLVVHKQRLFFLTFMAAVLGVFGFGIGTSTTWIVLAAIFLGFIGLSRFMKPTEELASTPDWTRLMFWSLFTHPLLDAHTSWGTQLLWPLPWKYAWNNIFVADPLYTIPMLIALIVILFMGRKSPGRRLINWIGIGLSSVYMLFTIVMKGVTFRQFTNALDDQELDYEDISTRPTPLNSILWTANVDMGDAYLMAYYSVFDTQPIEFIRVEKDEQLLGKWKDHPKVKRLWHLSAGEFAITEKNDTLIYNDLRFGMFGEPKEGGEFVFAYQLIPDGDDIIVKEIPPPRPEGEEAGALLDELWTRVQGN
jgi:inner membrane protein